jgi:hypothetical protein
MRCNIRFARLPIRKEKNAMICSISWTNKFHAKSRVDASSFTIFLVLRNYNRTGMIWRSAHDSPRLNISQREYMIIRMALRNHTPEQLHRNLGRNRSLWRCLHVMLLRRFVTLWRIYTIKVMGILINILWEFLKCLCGFLTKFTGLIEIYIYNI